MKFEDLGLAEPLLAPFARRATPPPPKFRPPPFRRSSKGATCWAAQTGTGKTAAFALPTLQRLGRKPSAASTGAGGRSARWCSPPRANWPCKSARVSRPTAAIPAVRQAAIYGGVGQSPQVRRLNHGVDVLIATPGRLLDLMQQGFVDLSHVEVLILDEADRMLDMGFIHDLRRIMAKVPRGGRRCCFPPRLPPAIRTLADQWLTDPVDVRVAHRRGHGRAIRQSVFFVDQKQKLQLLTHWLRETPWTRTLVFTRTKHGADKVARSLAEGGHSRPTPFTATRANRRGSACCSASRRRSRWCWWPPTLPPAGWTSTTSRTSSTSICRPMRTTISIASAARAAQAQPASPSPSAIMANGPLCRRSSASRGKRWQSKTDRRAWPPNPARDFVPYENGAWQTTGP